MIDASHIKVHPHAAGTRGVQHQATPGRGCAWYADPSTCHGRYHSGLLCAGELIAGLTAGNLLAENCGTWWRTPFSASQAMWGNHHPLCKMQHLILCRRAYSLYYPMGGYLVTTLSNNGSIYPKPEVDTHKRKFPSTCARKNRLNQRLLSSMRTQKKGRLSSLFFQMNQFTTAINNLSPHQALHQIIFSQYLSLRLLDHFCAFRSQTPPL